MAAVAELEKNYDFNHLFDLLIPGQFCDHWTICLYWDLCKRVQHYAYHGIRSGLVLESCLWLW